jgi:hypothetical protein
MPFHQGHCIAALVTATHVQSPALLLLLLLLLLLALLTRSGA